MTSTNPSIVEDLQPASGTVDAENLLNQVEKYILQHAILPQGASAALTLWCLATYNIDLFRIFPKLAVISPEKRCGKSTVLDLIEAFSLKSLATSSISTAGIYRIIEDHHPTLLIDEADMFIKNGDREMLGVINSGHSKSKAYVVRCIGEKHTSVRFSTWTPMVLASIGDLATTIMDRSVVIPLRRKTQKESVTRIPASIPEDTLPARQQLLKWSIDNTEAIQKNTIEPPDLGNDRAVDNWLPLFTIANQVSPAWFSKCEEAYGLLNIFEEDPLPSTLVLADIRDIFTQHQHEKIPSASLINKLNAMEDHPWCEYQNGRPISQNGLAKLLKVYGIKPKGIRYKGNTPRGYELDQFTDAFARYLPLPP